MASLPLLLWFRIIDSILTKWIASMTNTRKPWKRRGGSDEAARLFPQQRVLPGQNRVEPEGLKRRPSAASFAQGRAMRPGLSRDQSAGAGADAGKHKRRR